MFGNGASLCDVSLAACVEACNGFKTCRGLTHVRASIYGLDCCYLKTYVNMPLSGFKSGGAGLTLRRPDQASAPQEQQRIRPPAPPPAPAPPPSPPLQDARKSCDGLSSCWINKWAERDLDNASQTYGLYLDCDLESAGKLKASLWSVFARALVRGVSFVYRVYRTTARSTRSGSQSQTSYNDYSSSSAPYYLPPPSPPFPFPPQPPSPPIQLYSEVTLGISTHLYYAAGTTAGCVSQGFTPVSEFESAGRADIYSMGAQAYLSRIASTVFGTTCELDLEVYTVEVQCFHIAHNGDTAEPFPLAMRRARTSGCGGAIGLAGGTTTYDRITFKSLVRVTLDLHKVPSMQPAKVGGQGGGMA